MASRRGQYEYATTETPTEPADCHSAISYKANDECVSAGEMEYILHYRIIG